MGLGQVTRPEDQGVHPQLVEEGGLGTEVRRLRHMTRKGLPHRHDGGLPRGFGRRDTGEQGRHFPLESAATGDCRDPVRKLGAQVFGTHARQHAQVQVQRTVATDAVGVVAAVDMTQIEGGTRYRKRGMAIAAREFLAPSHEVSHNLLHTVEGIAAQARVTRMAGPADEAYRFSHYALVQTHGGEPGRLPDHGVATDRTTRVGQRPGATHGGLFVRGGQDHQGSLQVLRRQPPCRLDGDPQEGFHVTGAESIEPTTVFRELEGVMTPVFRVVGHRVRVPRQHQPPRSRSQGRNQIDLTQTTRHRHRFGAESRRFQPVGQQTDDGLIGLIQLGIDAADGGRGDQGLQHGGQRG